MPNDITSTCISISYQSNHIQIIWIRSCCTFEFWSLPHTTTSAHILQIKKSVAISNIHFYLKISPPTFRPELQGFSRKKEAPSDVFLRSFALPATSKACKNSSDTSWICIFFSSGFSAKTYQTINEQANSSKKKSSSTIWHLKHSDCIWI